MAASGGAAIRVKTMNGAARRMALSWMLVQLLAMALLLLLYEAPAGAFLWLHSVVLAIATFLAIGLSVRILHYWN